MTSGRRTSQGCTTLRRCQHVTHRTKWLCSRSRCAQYLQVQVFTQNDERVTRNGRGLIAGVGVNSKLSWQRQHQLHFAKSLIATASRCARGYFCGASRHQEKSISTRLCVVDQVKRGWPTSNSLVCGKATASFAEDFYCLLGCWTLASRRSMSLRPHESPVQERKDARGYCSKYHTVKKPCE